MNEPSDDPDSPISAEQLVRRMGHDFNNLFSIMLGGLTLLREEVPESAWDENVQEIYDDILSAATEAVDVVTRLTAWAGRQALSPRPTDLDELAGDLASLLRRVLPESIEVRCERSGGGVRALVDPDRLQDALLELAANARDAMPGGGHVTLVTGGGPAPCIAIADDGEGMTADLIARSVQPYFSTRDNGTRRGMGLSVVQGFARASGGRLAIESEPGRGTCVTLHLPAS